MTHTTEIPTPTAPQAPPEPETSTRTVCPRCGSEDIRESTTRRGADLLPNNMGRTAYRCRTCRGRFHLKSAAAAAAKPTTRNPKRKRGSGAFWKRPNFKRQLVEASIIAGSLVVFGLFLFLLARSAEAF